MTSSPVKSVTIEYQDGSTATFQKSERIVGMRHTIIRNFPGGANPKEVDAFKSHTIVWDEKK